MSGVGVGLAWTLGERNSPPTHTSPVSPVDHGSLVATLLIAKNEAGGEGAGSVCVGGECI